MRSQVTASVPWQQPVRKVKYVQQALVHERFSFPAVGLTCRSTLMALSFPPIVRAAGGRNGQLRVLSQPGDERGRCGADAGQLCRTRPARRRPGIGQEEDATAVTSLLVVARGKEVDVERTCRRPSSSPRERSPSSP